MLIKLILLIELFIICKGDWRSKRVRRIVGGEPAPPPPVDDPVVYTNFGGKSSKVEGVVEFPNYVFKGIRYAYPPIGKDRFLRPRQYFLNGYENATSFPPPCVQPIPGEDRVIGSEDCLFLNIFTPSLPTGMEGYPVVIWIHGGGYRYGSASQYGVRHLVGKKIIIVTIQYRLGSLGFLSTGTKELPGNAALWDMVLAVQWTRNYIGFFGGNPHRIVVMGHGSGASSAMLVALSNVAKGLANGVVAMSGSAVSRFATDEAPLNTAIEIAEENGCPIGSTITMVRCLQSLSASSVIRKDSNIEFQRIEKDGFLTGMSGRTGCAPVTEGIYDGRSLPNLIEKQPVDQLSSEDHPKIPLLTGITKHETKKACQGHYKKDIIHNLKNVPNFLENVLVKNLQGLVGINNILKKFENSTNLLKGALDPLHFRNYLQFQPNNLDDGLDKVSEATSDALFNVPAFLTADFWSKKGSPTYLYSFDHVAKRSLGHYFLKGSPLIGNSSDETNHNIVSHGDELSFLFDPQDIEGNPIQNPNDYYNEDDEKVRDVFSQMISDFARYGKVTLGTGNDIRPFSSTENNFIQVNTKPKLINNFRYCQMALWCGLSQRLQSSTCSFLKVLDTQLTNIQATINDSQKKINNVLDGVGKYSSNRSNFGISSIKPHIPTITNILGRKLG